MNNIEKIIFDLDGTLTDSKEGITKCIQFALRELGAGFFLPSAALRLGRRGARYTSSARLAERQKLPRQIVRK